MSIPEIIELVYTTANPETGSQPPKYVAWVVFEHGTVFLTFPKDHTPVDASAELLQQRAIEALQDLGEPIAGTSSADFNVGRLPWFEEQFVYVITYDSQYIFNIASYSEETNDIAVGIFARALRADDAISPKVLFVRDFQAQKTSFE